MTVVSARLRALRQTEPHVQGPVDASDTDTAQCMRRGEKEFLGEINNFSSYSSPPGEILSLCLSNLSHNYHFSFETILKQFPPPMQNLFLPCILIIFF